MGQHKEIKELAQSQKAKRSNLAKWWAGQITELDLPTGLHVLVRDIDIEDLIYGGNLPNTLIEALPELQGMSNEEAGKKIMADHPHAFAQLLDEIAKCCLVEPAIGEKTDGITTLALKDMRGKDKMFLFNWANREAEAVRPFRVGEDEPDPNPQPG